MADVLRKVRFNFGGDGGQFDTVFVGYTDDTHWNGFLNVWVEPGEYKKRVRPHMCPRDAKPDEAVEDLDLACKLAEHWVDTQGRELWGDEIAKQGLVSLARCFTTCEIERPARDHAVPILEDILMTLEGAIDRSPDNDPDHPDDDLWGFVELAKENVEAVLPLLRGNRCNAHRALEYAYGIERMIHEGKPVAKLRKGISLIITHLEAVKEDKADYNGN